LDSFEPSGIFLGISSFDGTSTFLPAFTASIISPSVVVRDTVIVATADCGTKVIEPSALVVIAYRLPVGIIGVVPTVMVNVAVPLPLAFVAVSVAVTVPVIRGVPLIIAPLIVVLAS